MKRVFFTLTISFLILISTSFIKAQSTANLENLKPEVELIIGLNHPKDSEMLQLQNNNDEDETDSPNTGIDGITLDNNNDDVEDDIIEDYLEDLLDGIGGEPEKEELVLERLKRSDINIVSLYPNPAINFINVKVEDEDGFEIEIYDLIGNLVIANKLESSLDTALKIDIDNLQSGIYLMHIITDKERIFRKFGVK